MKKILLILSVALIGCQENNICLRCEKQGVPDYDVCENQVVDISLVAYNLTNQGYKCYRTD